MLKSRHKFEKIAEDNNSPLIHNWLFIKGISRYKILGIDGPVMAIWSRNNHIEYLAKMSTWVKAHEELKKRALADHDYVEKLIDMADAHGRKMNAWTEKEIFKAPLANYKPQKLVSLYKQFALMDSEEYVYGVALSILDFQGFSLVENTIEKYLKAHVLGSKYLHYFSVFTEPRHNSFAQDQEESLMRLMSHYYYKSKTWRRDVIKLQLADLAIRYPKFAAALKRHAAKYAWVYYVYRGPAYAEEDFLNFIRDSLSRKIDPRVRLKALAVKKRKIATLRKKYLHKLKPDPFILKMLRLASKLVWAKPRRKDYQSRSYYHIESLQKEISRRLYLSVDQVRSLPIHSVESMLLQNKGDVRLAQQMRAGHICVRVGDDNVRILSGKSAEAFAKKHISPIKKRGTLLHSTKELRGQIAFAGRAKGLVKIINRLEDVKKMNYGDILVSVATTPSIVPAMKKAAAIVTDEGGLTCHASIVSRELEIPCVIGVKIATQVLRDGDLVEVDAIKGSVKKFSK